MGLRMNIGRKCGERNSAFFPIWSWAQHAFRCTVWHSWNFNFLLQHSRVPVGHCILYFLSAVKLSLIPSFLQIFCKQCKDAIILFLCLHFSRLKTSFLSLSLKGKWSKSLTFTTLCWTLSTFRAGESKDTNIASTASSVTSTMGQ